MKLGYKLLAAVAGLMALSSCVEEAIGPLTGQYEKPVTYELNTVKDQSVVKGESLRTFNVTLTNETATLAMKFTGDKYFLADGGYTASVEAKKGTYLVGNGGSTFTLNGNTVGVDAGTLTVVNTEGTYSFTGMLWLADESVVEIKSAVNLVYEADPEPVVLKNVISATSNVASGTNSLTINLATADVTATYDAATWSNVFSGTGNYLALDIYSEDGYLHEGTYTASAVGGAINAGEFGIGWDPGDLWGIGMVFENWGTCWWDVNNGATSVNQKVTEGTVTVSKKGSKWVIELVSGEGKSMLWTKFEGAIPELTAGGSTGGDTDDTDYVELSALLSATSNVANGTKSLTMNLGTDGISSTTDPTTWQTVWEGEGNYLGLDIYSEDGKLYTGTYNACAAGGTINAGEFGIGWDPGDLWGIGMVFENWGTCWWNVANGAAVAAGKVTDGTVEVLVQGTDLVIKVKSSLVNAKFTYPVADFPIEVVNLGGGSEPEAPEFEGTELSVLLSATSNVANGTKSVTINLGEEGISSTTDPTTWQTTWEGEGHYLALDVYSEDGKLAPGTYTACAVGGTINAGEFGIGWDPGDLWGIGMVFENWGTCWWNVANGAAVAEAKVLDGTLTVAVDGDVYTITLESSAVNAQYVGPMTL